MDDLFRILGVNPPLDETESAAIDRAQKLSEEKTAKTAGSEAVGASLRVVDSDLERLARDACAKRGNIWVLPRFLVKRAEFVRITSVVTHLIVTGALGSDARTALQPVTSRSATGVVRGCEYALLDPAGGAPIGSALDALQSILRSWQ